ncbi:hypothetical protein BT69DRAFT_1374868, partial [Atractiella rhizophila]
GVVVQVGEGVSEFKVGDQVASFTKIRAHTRYGAYQQYTCSPVNTTFHLPPNTTFEEAATYPLAYMTACLALFRRLDLPTPFDDVEKVDLPPVLIYGAGSSVGSFAVQLAKFAGLKVIGIAGTSKTLAKELGSTVIDYRSKSSDELAFAIASAFENIPSSTPVPVFDAVTQPESLSPILSFLSSRSGGGKIATVLPLPSDITLPAGGKIDVEQTRVAFAHGEEGDFAKRWYGYLGTGTLKVKPNRVKLMPRGLAGVEEGVQMLKEGKVSGVKLVYRIEETPGL